jgi:hypothetical protein
MACKMKEAKGDAAINSAAEKNSNLERILIRHIARKIFGVDACINFSNNIF